MGKWLSKLGLRWDEIKQKLSNEGALNKQYDPDLDGKIADAEIKDVDWAKILNKPDLSVYEEKANKGQADGYCELDANALIPLTRIPSTLTGKDADSVDGYHASAFEKVANKGQPNGYCELDANGKVPKERLPPTGSLYASDESEVSTTSTSPTSVKEFNLVKLASIGHDWKKMKVIAELKTSNSAQTTKLDVVIGGSTKATLTTTSTGYVLKTAEIDISGLGNGKHFVQFKLYTTGATAYLRLLEVWVE